MKARRLSQKLHKWLGLVVGIQLVIWSISGFYMVVVNIDIIHGDHLVHPSLKLNSRDIELFSSQLKSLANANPDASTIALKSMNGSEFLEIRKPDETRLIKLSSGEEWAPIGEDTARSLAKSYYAGSGVIRASTLIETNPPREIGKRPLPLWRVDFDDVWGSTLYISPSTGALVTRRHTLWRVFDFLWMLHIMDYDEREDVNNLVLRIVSILAFLLVLSGVWYY